MQLETHQLMRNSDLIEHRAFGYEAEAPVEGHCVYLRVQMDPLKSPAHRCLDEPSQ
jgi:hypothetical protein